MRAYLADEEAAAVERGFLARRLRAVRTRSWLRTRDARRRRDGDAGDLDLAATRRPGDARAWSPTSRAARRHGSAGPRPRPPLRLALPATPESVARGAAGAAELGRDTCTPTARERDGILLAVSEAATNAVRHAYPGGAERRRLPRPRRVGRRTAAARRGRGRRRRPRRRAPRDPGLGMGLPLLSQLAATVAARQPARASAGLRGADVVRARVAHATSVILELERERRGRRPSPSGSSRNSSTAMSGSVWTWLM